MKIRMELSEEEEPMETSGKDRKEIGADWR